MSNRQPDLFGNKKPAKKQVFVCKICAKAPTPSNGYPRSSRWKTQKGFDNHNCYAGVEERRIAADELAAVELAEFEKLWPAYAERFANRAVGDTAFVVVEQIVKDTHEWNGRGRLVKVRYEAVKRFTAEQGIISGIAPSSNRQHTGTYLQSLIDKESSAMISYQITGVSRGSIRFKESMEEAERDAASAQISYDKHVSFSQMCR